MRHTRVEGLDKGDAQGIIVCIMYLHICIYIFVFTYLELGHKNFHQLAQPYRVVRFEAVIRQTPT